MKKILEKLIKENSNQKKLAEKIGVSQFTISRWLNGEGVNAKYLKAISDATNGEITVEQLATELDYRRKQKNDPSQTN